MHWGSQRAECERFGRSTSLHSSQISGSQGGSQRRAARAASEGVGSAGGQAAEPQDAKASGSQGAESQDAKATSSQAVRLRKKTKGPVGTDKADALVPVPAGPGEDEKKKKASSNSRISCFSLFMEVEIQDMMAKLALDPVPVEDLTFSIGLWKVNPSVAMRCLKGLLDSCCFSQIGPGFLKQVQVDT